MKLFNIFPFDRFKIFIIIKSMQKVAKFCSFEKYFKYGGIGAVRYELGRASNKDMMCVGLPLVLKFSDTANAAGCVNASIEAASVFFNGIFGTPEIPHMTKGMLKETKNISTLVAYVRSVIPPSHPLVANGWAALPPDQHVLQIDF